MSSRFKHVGLGTGLIIQAGYKEGCHRTQGEGVIKKGT
jgi:hypothetical protein